MAYLIFTFGFLLSGAGAYDIFSGYTIIDIERGWTAVIAGSVLLSGGMIVMSLAFVAANLNRLNQNLQNIDFKSGKVPTVEPGSFAAAADAAETILPDPESRSAYFEPPASLAAAQQQERYEASSDPEKSVSGFAENQQETASREGFGEAAPSPWHSRAVTVEPAPLEFAVPPAQNALDGPNKSDNSVAAPLPRETKFMPPRWGAEKPQAPRPEAEPEPHLTQEHQEPPPAAPITPAPIQKPVTGRYEADGVVYTLFDDGSIEARSADEVVHYASMEALKASFANEAEG